MKTSRQLNALIRNMAKDKSINAQIILRNFMLERLLERISLSPYRENLILKGGMLVAAMVGLDTRATMDMDTTLKGYPLTEESVRSVFADILAVPVEDHVTLTLKKLEEIRDEAEYSGIRVTLEMLLDETRQTLKVDITTGNPITPAAVDYSFRLLFEDRSIQIKAYNLETVLAEKLETIFSRSTANTRMRDFYDVYVLWNTRRSDIRFPVMKEAFERTVRKRESDFLLRGGIPESAEALSGSKEMKELWTRYQKKYTYADDIAWEDAVAAAKELYENAMAVTEDYNIKII
ncbi:nucleotidyl transferase AbiEii/AbiGii toxin family protein [Caproicibacter fermentans]|uniref:Nucleotidyl transferase AbiEii/AbiGii toxin family protein n=1 Tax=Caproicibacter fermentans TaxID=2576756 RepID=A0A7G8T8R5_9FIRM|nr:nucleotidyl transferase AbiEii/AbiGii toxin family protein [Caproicibacter fermentans]QNK40006.1 nucleotidyl transferase AbiEii/AbiGii toxin family protein [Caproicibacter fermentans]